MASAIIVGTNSYISTADASTYFSGRLGADAWDAASTGDKEKALIQACRAIERQALKGWKYDQTQTLAFPRTMFGIGPAWGTFFVSNVPTVPQVVKDAQCEEALALLQYKDSPRIEAQRQNVASISLGVGSESYTGRTRNMLSYDAQVLMRSYLAGAVMVR